MARNIRINFDLDGTIADLYGVENWLNQIIAEDTAPYENAQPLVKFTELTRQLNRLQKNGYEIAVITWLARGATAQYNNAVANAKREWLARYLPNVHWNEITIVPYGTPKENYCNNPLDVLFDDEEPNRNNWTGRAYDVQNIVEILTEM